MDENCVISHNYKVLLHKFLQHFLIWYPGLPHFKHLSRLALSMKWAEMGPTDDTWINWDDLETFGDHLFWRGQTLKKIIYFFEIQNIHSKQIFII